MVDFNVDTDNSPQVIVTDRSYATVLRDLSLPDGYFANKKILSVGEGLSGFAKKAAEKNVDIIAVDRVYHYGDKILKADPPANYSPIDASHRSLFRTYREAGEEFDPPTPDKVKMAAGDVYTLPFKDHQFDLIVANRLFEHVEMDKALPEMMRLLSSGGELRMGVMMLDCSPRDGQLIAGYYGKDPETSEYVLNENIPLLESLKDVSDAYPDLTIYILVGRKSNYSVVYKYFGAHAVKNLIFVRGSNKPVIENIISDNQTQSGYEGKLYKLDPVTLKMDEVPIP